MKTQHRPKTRLRRRWSSRSQSRGHWAVGACRRSMLEPLEMRAMLSAGPLMNQFSVHETTALDESVPAIAVIETSGRFVAAWTSFEVAGSDDSGLGVYAGRYFADGTPDGPAFLVNGAQTEDDQLAPELAVDETGHFVVTWQGQDADGAGIFAQRYRADGTAEGPVLAVNHFTDGEQQAPSVAMDSVGNFVISWQSMGQDGDSWGVYARRYDAAGVALESNEFLVNTTTVGNQAAPDVAMARDTGNFSIVWEGDVQAEHASVEIFAHLYDADANSIRSEFQVNTGVAKDQAMPDVAMDAQGHFVVTWTSEGIPGSGSDVFAQRFDHTGNLSGGEFRVNETTLQGQRNSVVTMDGDGDFFVTWQSSHQDEFSWGIFGRAYDSSGDVLTTELQVNTYAEQPQTSPVLASNSEGQAVALWLGLDEDHASAVHGQRYQLPTSSGNFTTVGGEFVLANYVGLEDTSAAATVDANRNFLVTWQSYGDDGSGLGIMAQRLNPDGAPHGDAVVVNTTTTGNQMNPDAAMDSVGNTIVVWESTDSDGSRGIFARRLDNAGNPVGAEFQVNTQVVGDQTQPSVAMSTATGEFVIVWQGPDDSGQGIYGQRFNASGDRIGREFPVNAQTDLDQVSPEISMNALGQFAVTWVSDHRALIDPENDSEKSIFVQWYDIAGNAIGEEQLVHTIVKEYQAQEYPDVAMDADGNMIVVWQSITQDGSAWGVYGRQFLADKTPVQPAEFQINQTTDLNQRRATVVCDPQGNFTVSWQSDRQDQAATAILSRQYHADGTPETDEMVVNTWELGPQILPVMAMTPSGDFGIFWDGQGTSRLEGIHGRIFEEGYVPPEPHITAAPVDDQILVSEAGGLEQSFPAVAVIENNGHYVAAWTSFEQSDGDVSGLGIYAQTFLADGTPDSDAFLVHTAYTTDDQSNPAVAADGGGNFVVVWQSLRQDGDGWGIYAQRYGAHGRPLGDSFQVNAHSSGHQSHPAVAMDDEGNFVIAWQSDGQDSDGWGIYARRYNHAGVPLDTTENLINTTVEGNQSAPTAARNRVDGRYIIGWQSEVLGNEGEVDVNVLAQRYYADGNPLDGEFTVNTILSKDQVGPRVAMGTDSSFFFAWTSEGQVGSGADVFARRFDSTGTGLDDDFRVNDTTRQGQQYPAVAMDDYHNYLVTWQSSHQDGFSWGIFAKAYDSGGAVLAPEFQVNANAQGPQTNPALSASTRGDAVALWLGLDVTHKSAVHAQRFQLPQTAPDFLVGPEGEIVLSNFRALEEAPAAAAADAEGNYVVTWQSYGQDGSGLGIYARRFDTTGLPLEDAFLVTNTTDGNQSHPDVAMDFDGNFIVTWQTAFQDGDGYGVYARRFGADGSAHGDEFPVNTSNTGHQGVPSIAMDPDDGSAVIVWQGPDADGLGIFGQRYDAAGMPVGGEFQLNTHAARDQFSPAISMNAAGQFAVVWVSDHRAEFDPTDTEKSIFVQWYDADGLAVGEEVLVHRIQAEFEAQEHPDVALDGDGDFVVGFQSINQDGNTWGVFVRQFLADKTPIQPEEFQINQTVLAPQRHPSVISDAEGNFVVAWQAHKQDASGPGVMARVFDSLAVAQTDEFLLPTWEQGPQTSPVMAMTPTGSFGVFWTGHGTDRAEGAHGRIYTLDQHNIAPSITALESSHDSLENRSDDGLVTITGSYFDRYPALDQHTVLVDWGDGLQETLPDAAVDQTHDRFTYPHAYSAGGIYTITVTVEDSEGGISMLASTMAVVRGVGQVDGMLYAIGTDEVDRVFVRRMTAGQIQVRFKFGDERFTTNYVDANLVDKIVVHLFGGDDIAFINANLYIANEMDGGAGNDTLTGSSRTSLIVGGPGDDFIWGRDGNDLLRGGPGDDWIGGGGGNDVILGGEGNDLILGETGNDTLDGEPGDDRLYAGSGINHVLGGAGNDLLRGGSDDEWMSGGSGDDQLLGFRGNDWLEGGDGDDTLHGHNGNDWLDGGSGNDMLYGDQGHDVLLGREGLDQLFGGGGRDLLIGGLGHDLLQAGEGDDILAGGTTPDDAETLEAVMASWTADDDYATRVSNLSAQLTIVDDEEQDSLEGAADRDIFFDGLGDVLVDRQDDEMVI